MADKYDGITIGTLATERWFEERGVITSDSMNVLYNAAITELEFDGPGVNNLPDDDITSLVYQIIATDFGGAVDVKIQDQHTPVVIANFTSLDAETTNTVATAIDDTTITLTDTTGFVDGITVTIFNPDELRFSFMKQLGAPAGSVITVDTPLDFAYPIGSFLSAGSDNLAVNGSVTPQIFALRNTTTRTPISIDITRLIFTALTVDAIDLSKFGDIVGGLTKGIVLRMVNGVHSNIFNAKTNGELANLMFDFEPATANNPAQGQDGFLGRLTFAGQNKVGVTIRIEENDDLQLIVQDDLSSITSFQIKMEGHIVENG